MLVTNALVVPLLLALGLAVVVALAVGPLHELWMRKIEGARARARSLLGVDEPARRQQRIIREIEVGVPRKAERTPHSRVLPPVVRVHLHPSDISPIVRNRAQIEADLNEDWQEQAHQEGWHVPDYVEIEPVTSNEVRLGRVRLELLYHDPDNTTPRFDPPPRPRARPSSTPTSAKQVRTATLHWSHGGRDHELELHRLGQQAVAGRSPSCDIHIDYSHASKKHVEFVLKTDGVLIRDLNSMNGTFVDGQAIGQTIADRDVEIALGRNSAIRLTWP